MNPTVQTLYYNNGHGREAREQVASANRHLEFLSRITKIVFQECEALPEIFRKFPPYNQFKILNGTGELLCYAGEIPSRVHRWFQRRKNHPLRLKFVDVDGKRLMTLNTRNKREYEYEVKIPDGRPTFSVFQDINAAFPSFYVMNMAEQIIAPSSASISSTSNVIFDVKYGGIVVGHVTKRFGITIPADFGCAEKASLIAAAFVIYYKFYKI